MCFVQIQDKCLQFQSWGVVTERLPYLIGYSGSFWASLGIFQSFNRQLVVYNRQEAKISRSNCENLFLR